MARGVCRHADAKAADRLRELDQLESMRQFAWWQRGIAHGVPCERHQVLDPRFPETNQYVGQLQSGVAATGEMRHRVERCQAQH